MADVSEEQLAVEAWVVGSEFRLLVDAAVAAGLGEGNRHLATEAMVVNLRALGEFLVGRPRRKGRQAGRSGDLHAWQYAPRWIPAPAEAVKVLDDVVARADKHLAHLTAARAREVQHWRSWRQSTPSSLLLSV